MSKIARYGERQLDNQATAKAAVKARRSAKLQQKQVAKRMGIASSKLCNLERGRADWSELLIISYEKALNGGK